MHVVNIHLQGCSTAGMALPRAVADCLPHNPGLDEEQAHRACIAEPVPETLAAWDALASAIALLKNSPAATPEELAEKYGMVLLRPSQPNGCTCRPEVGVECTGQCGWVPLTLPNLQLYMVNCSARAARQALCAGFFPFGSEFQLPGTALAERSFLNYELVGEGPGRENGRIVLDLANGGVLKGRKARKAFADCVEPVADSTVEAWCTGALRAAATCNSAAAPPTFAAPLRGVMTVNRAFDAVHAGIVAAKGVDWMGFTRVRRLLALLRDAGLSLFSLSLSLSSPPPFLSSLSSSSSSSPSASLGRCFADSVWNRPTEHLGRQCRVAALSRRATD